MRLSEVGSSSRENNLNLIRLIAATSVAFAHSFALLNGETSMLWGGLVDSGMFGFVAVAVFFGLSGFLITQSFERRKSWFQYLEARWLRIFPGLFFSCLFTTILVSQFVTHQGWEAFLDIRNWRQSFGAFFFDYNYLDGVFDTNPTHGVNGSLWTLPIEFRMYIFVLVFGLLGLVARRYLFLAFSLLMLICGILQFELVTEHVWPVLFRIRNYSFSYYSLPFCFIMGMLFYLFREKIRLSFLVATALLVLSYFFNHWAMICVAFVYASFTFGYHPRAYLRRLNFKADLSYGIYVLAFPIQQTLIFNGFPNNAYLFFLVTIACTVPAALISWYGFEKPGLALKGRFRRSSTNPPANAASPQTT